MDEGFEGGLYDTTRNREIRYKEPKVLFERRRLRGTTTGQPRYFTVLGWNTTSNAPVFEFDTTADQTYSLTLDYIRRRPILWDRPAAPTLAAGAVGNPNGVLQYRVAFVSADGECLGRTVSITVTSDEVAISAIPTVPTFLETILTSRKIYRTANAGSTFKLLTTLSDNTTTTYTDNTLDAGLGADAPTTYTGLERLPVDIQDLLHRGVMALDSEDLGANRAEYEARYEKDLKKAKLRHHGRFEDNFRGQYGLKSYGMH